MTGPGTAAEALIEDGRHWRRRRVGDLTVCSVGHHAVADAIAHQISGSPQPDLTSLAEFLRKQHDHFACIIEAPGFLLAAVDRVRSLPLFVGWENGRPIVSNSARALAQRLGDAPFDRDSLLEYTMAGYVTGRRTLRRGVQQFQSGDLYFASTHGDDDRFIRYYRYYPVPEEGGGKARWLEELAAVWDSVCRRMVAKADGSPIWIPLSGGYDSRILAAKLHEMGYDDLTCFTYGPPLNHDAKVARHVASTLGLRWHWIPSDAAESRKFFFEDRRRRYCDYADHLSIIPSLREYHALTKLEPHIPDDAVMINGQSGDYLTGAHIPAQLYNAARPDLDVFYDALIAKHWSLWTNLNTPENLAFVRSRVGQVLSENPDRDLETLFAEYEAWEAEERQSKFVINGQRMYEFFGWDWQLPHWDGELLDYWARVPFQHKFDQNLYKDYLTAWNYKDLFPENPAFLWRWPLHMMWVIPLARAVGLAAGRSAKDRVYKFFWYFSHYRNHYAAYGFPRFFATMNRARSPISLQVELWLRENGVIESIDDLSGDFNDLPSFAGDRLQASGVEP